MTFGKVGIAKDNEVVSLNKDGSSLSPHLQELCLSKASDLVPARASADINNTFLEKLVSTSGVYRLLQEYGADENVCSELEKPLREEELVSYRETEDVSERGSKKEIIYAMFDGGLLFFDEGWKEVKLGRVFLGSQIVPQNTDSEQFTRRNRVFNSEYIARKGHCSKFVAKFGRLVRAHMEARPEAQLVFITDGAPWMREWITNNFPEATAILDFYHACEHIFDFLKLLYADKKERDTKCKEWKNLLCEGRTEELSGLVAEYKEHNEKAISDKAKTLFVYLSNNTKRMLYGTFRDEGLFIGSGAIESAVSAVVQQRCKLKGQRWGKHVQPVLNIRTIYRSGKGKRLNNIINKRFGKAA